MRRDDHYSFPFSEHFSRGFATSSPFYLYIMKLLRLCDGRSDRLRWKVHARNGFVELKQQRTALYSCAYDLNV